MYVYISITGAIDMMHKGNHRGLYWLDDDNIKVAQLLRRPWKGGAYPEKGGAADPEVRGDRVHW
jgi:hypothetical protein